MVSSTVHQEDPALMTFRHKSALDEALEHSRGESHI